MQWALVIVPVKQRRAADTAQTKGKTTLLLQQLPQAKLPVFYGVDCTCKHTLLQLNYCKPAGKISETQ